MGLKATLFVGAKAAQTNYYSAELAEWLGLGFTHHVTINFASTNIDPRDAVPCFSLLRRFDFSPWARRPKRKRGPVFAPTYTYAFENVRDGIPFQTMEQGEPHNVHVHWAVHIPPGRLHEFEQLIWEWVEKRTGGIHGPETIKIDPITTTLGGYFVKGARPFFVTMYGRGQDPEPQGIIYGLRADTSRNLGPKARRAADRQRGIRRRLPSNGPKNFRPEYRPPA